MAMLGLRGKSLVALLLSCALALIPAAFIAWQGVETVRNHFGLAYARNHTLLHREQIFAPVSRELALASRLANSVVTRRWLSNLDDAAARDLFFEEAEGYRADLRDHSYFVADSQGHYYYNDSKAPVSTTPRYTTAPDKASDNWYYATMRSPDAYNINVELSAQLKITNVWFNVAVQDGGRRLGVVGTGLNLSKFLNDFLATNESGVTPIIIDRNGAIQAHPDTRRIAYGSVSEKATEGQTAFGLLGSDAERASLRTAMAAAEAKPANPIDLWATVDGKRQLLVLAYIPDLRWHVLSVVDLRAAQVIDPGWATQALIAFVLLLAALLIVFGYAVERLVLKPLRRLQQSAQAISAGRYDTALPDETDDEIGELSRAFGAMAAKVQTHTAELEERVRERTKELQAANSSMAAAHKQIDDSIDYASLIQRAILPDRQMVQSLGAHHFVMWHPRDVVGGDFYVFLPDGDNCLLGVVDCAGHGVAGALMTMLARAAIDHAIKEVGARDPAAILARTDAAMRAMLRDTEMPRSLATNMDAGLVYVDRATGLAHFAGAKMSLYASDGVTTQEFPGGRRALGERRLGEYSNTVTELSGRTFYMITDGVLDQAGGEHGYGFGSRRFAELLQSIAGESLQDQAAAVEQALVNYRGDLPQRDDITILSFRFE